ncbi:MAG: hypothetical protein A4E59_01474 [Syntrophorhabdus sp. PtaB.Bin027]|jgi:hypothetical protein|nr:MAG: hypothetical protein A4E59_01474 [Syntrophorhabdus sp. PtaB.Bin027]HII95906.1 hypothetical protein [Methanofastidiosum sp.]
MSVGDDYLRLVEKYANSADRDKRSVRRRALKNLAENDCREELLYLIDKYAGSGDCDEREVRSYAFDYLEEMDKKARRCSR